MPRRRSSTPTEGELEILNVLWDHGPSTVRQIHNIVKTHRGTVYSTTLRMVQFMSEKGLLVRDDSVRPQTYAPAQSQEQTQLELVDYVIQSGFGGSAMGLVLRAVGSSRLTPEELAQINAIIAKAKGDRS